MPRACFISDLHLTSPDDPRTALLTRFVTDLADADNVSHLFLMGDIFDLWLADHDYFIERYQDVVDALVRLRDGGTEIHYFEGNHDLHLSRFWAGRLGFTVHADPVYIELAGLTLRLEHGDQMDPDDRGYRFLRWFLRTPPLRFLICHLPGNLVARIGERASATSRTYTSETKTISASDAVEKIRAHARRAHAARPFDLLVSGHVHIRDDYRFDTSSGEARSINLGTWLDAPCYLELDGGRCRLVELDDVAQSQPRKLASETP